MPTFGPSSVGASFDPRHAAPSGVLAHAALKEVAAAKPGASVHADSVASHKVAPRFSFDHVTAGHGVSDRVSGGSMRPIDALRHADSYAGSAGTHSYSLAGGVVHDRIFTAAHLAPVAVHSAHAPTTAHSGGAHSTITIGESTKLVFKDFSPKVGGGHFH